MAPLSLLYITNFVNIYYRVTSVKLRDCLLCFGQFFTLDKLLVVGSLSREGGDACKARERRTDLFPERVGCRCQVVRRQKLTNAFLMGEDAPGPVGKTGDC